MYTHEFNIACMAKRLLFRGMHGKKAAIPRTLYIRKILFNDSAKVYTLKITVSIYNLILASNVAKNIDTNKHISENENKNSVTIL